MKKKFAAALVISALLSTAAHAQQAPAAQPAVVQQAPSVVTVEQAAPIAGEATLVAGSEVMLTINEEVNSKSHRLGDKFFLTVAQDVKAGSAVVVPRGTRAVGQVLNREGKGSFGKAGKMLIAFRYLDMNGQRIPLDGTHRQEGDSATAATVGAVLAAGVVGGLFVKGKNARVADGREFTARIKDPIPVTLTDSGAAVISASYTPTPVDLEIASKKRQKKVDATKKRSK